MLYHAYQLHIRSELALPELVSPEGSMGEPQVTIRLGAVPADGLPDARQLGPYLWADPTRLWLQVPRVARFLIRDGREIVIDPAPGIDEDSLRVFLLGSAFGALLFQRGLHRGSMHGVRGAFRRGQVHVGGRLPATRACDPGG